MKKTLITAAVLVLAAGPAFAGSLSAPAVPDAGSASGVTAPDRDLSRGSLIEPGTAATHAALDRAIDGWRHRVAAYESGIARAPSESGRANAAALSQALAELEARRAQLDVTGSDTYADARGALNQALQDMAIVWDAVSVQT